jgi:hypothetical protein
MTTISIDAASVITGLSKRTWYRRVEEGVVARSGAGSRIMIPISEVVPLIGVEMSPEDLDMLAAADAGNAEAQDDMGQLFLASGKLEAAIYWLEQAARQGYPNAMQCLGRCYLAGEGVPKDENLAIMWIAKAAAHGHVIAQGQMQALRRGAAT